jgi:hypothetical protein
MSSEELKIGDLKQISEGMLYILPESLPGECLEDHVRTVQTYQVDKPTGEEIADHIIRLAKVTIMASQEPESVILKQADPYDLDLIRKMKDFEPEVVQALASDQPWIREYLRNEYVGQLFSQSYLAGETYLGLEIVQVDLSEEGLNCDKKDALKVLIETENDSPADLVANSYKQWGFELRLNQDGTPHYDLETLRERIVKEDLRASRDFGLDIEEPTEYDQNALLIVLPIAYEVARDVRVEDFSSLELSREAFIFCDEEMVMMHPKYDTFLEEQRIRKKQEVVSTKEPPKRPREAVLADIKDRGWEVSDGGKS